MARITPQDVKDIIDTDLDNRTLNVFINGANLTVTAVLGTSTSLSAGQKKEIERWLTAHLIASGPEPSVQKEEVMGETQIEYQGKTGKGLKATRYGQQVLLLDTTGLMAQGAGKPKPSIQVVTSFA